ncbi:MAG: hypothetical protein ACYTFY_20865, partial [Planctomycetota bacterium]
MLRYILTALTILVSTGSVSALELVKDGRAVSEIIISAQATPSVKTAAAELQRHLLKISGAELAIVNAPSADIKNQVYVGGSKFTKDLGVDLSDIKKDGYKIISKDNYLILAGKDSYHYTKLCERYFKESDLFRPRIHNNRLKQQIWEKYTGKTWRQPCYHDFRQFNYDYKFNVLDGTGTLYAVYAFLEQLGMRWFMPLEDIGIV